jgi:uncharacterized Zn-finger protein
MSKELENNPKLLPSICHLPCPNLNQNTLAPILETPENTLTFEFKCKTCLKSFKRKNSLTRHERIHTGLKPYLCAVCNKSFSRKDILESHKLSAKCQRTTQYHHNFYYSKANHERINKNLSDQTMSEIRRSSIDSLLSNYKNNEGESNNGDKRELSNLELSSEQLIFRFDKRSSPWFS